MRVTDDFLRAVEDDGDWDLNSRMRDRCRQDGEGPDLWEKIGNAAWACADPGIQYHTTINDWHTCPASGEIRASNPCSEYMFLDDTACNLASLNLLQFRDKTNSKFDVEAFRAWRAAVDDGARNLRDDGAVPVEGNRQTVLRVPHARPRLRQYRRHADDVGHSL